MDQATNDIDRTDPALPSIALQPLRSNLLNIELLTFFS